MEVTVNMSNEPDKLMDALFKLMQLSYALHQLVEMATELNVYVQDRPLEDLLGKVGREIQEVVDKNCPLVFGIFYDGNLH